MNPTLRLFALGALVAGCVPPSGSEISTADATSEELATIARADAVVARVVSAVLPGDSPTSILADADLEVEWLEDACGAAGWAWRLELRDIPIGPDGDLFTGEATLRTTALRVLSYRVDADQLEAVAGRSEHAVLAGEATTELAVSGFSLDGTDLRACGVYYDAGSDAWDATISYTVEDDDATVYGEFRGEVEVTADGISRAGVATADLTGGASDPVQIQIDDSVP